MKETKVKKSKGSQVKDLKDLAAVLSKLYVANQVEVVMPWNSFLMKM